MRHLVGRCKGSCRTLSSWSLYIYWILLPLPSCLSLPSISYRFDHQDHFAVVVENVTTVDWDVLIRKVKVAFTRYPSHRRWRAGGHRSRYPSTAMQGNVLEAINVTLNLLQFHYFDRDLHRSGNSIVVISAGCGVFEVDRSLAEITYQRMMDNGIGSDMLSLSRPPMHIAPFFLYSVSHSPFRGWKERHPAVQCELSAWLCFPRVTPVADRVFQSDWRILLGLVLTHDNAILLDTSVLSLPA